MLLKEPYYTPTIMSGPVVRWKLNGRGDNEISASRDCVHITGAFSFSKIEAYRQFLETLRDAHALHIEMKSSSDPHEIAKRYRQLPFGEEP
jgi:hypothetical protein